MSKLNIKNKFTQAFTHEGAPAARINAEQQLRRSVLSCLLWEKEFYSDGQEIADVIRTAAEQVPVTTLADLAVEVRSQFKLRHVPLYLTAILAGRARGTSLVSRTLEKVIQRADELTEFLAIYAKVNDVSSNALKPILSNQVRKGIAKAFHNFDEYQLAKYCRNTEVRLRDALFLSHAKPRNDEEAALWKRLIDNEMKTPDTWEVALSLGADKRETFERLLKENKLGYLALIRNLRNMAESGVERSLAANAILARKGAERVLPFRYVAAARAAPQFEPELDSALQASIKELPQLMGTTAVLVDVSGSMEAPLSDKSDLTRMDAAAALASIINSENIRMFSFSDYVKEVPPRRGMAGIDALVNSQIHNGTNLFSAVDCINKTVSYERLIVISDEQASSLGRSLPNPNSGAHGYFINVASYKNGVGYGVWNHLDGFSESVIRWLVELEQVKSKALENLIT